MTSKKASDLIGKIIKTELYSCLWCKGKEFYVKDIVYDGIYLDLYCTNKECGCRQSIKTDDWKFEEST